MYTYLEWFGAVTYKKDKTKEKRPNRRQIQKGKLRSELFDHGAYA